jgi:hypothetical protein
MRMIRTRTIEDHFELCINHMIVQTSLVVMSALTSVHVSLTLCNRSSDETDGAAGSVTRSIFVRFTSNFVTGRNMPRKKGLEKVEIQKLHTTTPEHLTDDELLLSTFCAEDLAMLN